MEQISIIRNQTGERIRLFTKEPFCTVKSATQEKNLMGDDTVKLSIITTRLLNFGKGDYIEVDGELYTLRTPATRQLVSDRYYTYDMVLYGVMYDLMKCLYRNTDASGKSSRSSFDLTYTLREFAKVIIYNMNRDYPGEWALDENNVPATEAKTISFANLNCLQVLQTICNKSNFNYDFQITRDNGVNTIHIGKFGSVIAPPGGGDAFEWGAGKGIYNLKEEKVDDQAIKTRLWVEGGTANLKSGYRDYSDRLQLPYPQRKNKYAHVLRDGTSVSANSQTIGISDDAKRYHEDAGLVAKIGSDEDYKSYDEIYPKRTGVISALGSDIYTFIDNTMDFDLNAKDQDGNTKYLIAGVSAKITFTSGKLAGQVFELKEKGYDNSKKQFTILPYQDERGQKFPTEGNTAFQFAVGDTYKLTEIMPSDTMLTKAEEDLWYESIQDFNDMKQARVKYTLTLDRLYMLQNTSNSTSTVVFKPGDYVHVKDSRFNIDKNIRITKVARNLLVQQDYAITLSDTVTISVAAQTVIDVHEHNAIIEANGLKDLGKARKAWRTTEELRNMIYDTDGYFDPENIKPNSIDTNMLTVGSKSQQFVLTGVLMEPNLGGNANTFKVSGGTLTHLAIAQSGVRSWTMTGSTHTLSNTNGYYVFAKCSKSRSTGVWYLSQQRLLVENDSDKNNFYFQVGILSAVYADDGFRDLVTTYGFTRINGNTITTGKIVTADGNNYLDLDGNKFRIGDASSSIDYNVTKDNQLTLRNVLLQSGSGDTAPIGVYRGTFNSNYTYYYGDEVSYTVKGATKTYRYKNTTATQGKLPTNGTYWEIIAQGADGNPGTTNYTWVKYADDAYGNGLSDSSDGKKYIGIAYNKTSSTESASPSDYQWSLIKGDDGASNYTWVKYSDVANPTSASQIYDTPKDTTEYIGIAVNQTEKTASTDPTKYIWGKIKGDPGVPGKNGDYFEYRYAVNGSLTDPPGLAVNQRTPSGWSTAQPEVASLKYLWRTMAKISGESNTLLQNWSKPVRVTAKDGNPGRDADFHRISVTGTNSTSTPNIFVDGAEKKKVSSYPGGLILTVMDPGDLSIKYQNSSYTNEDTIIDALRSNAKGTAYIVIIMSNGSYQIKDLGNILRMSYGLSEEIFTGSISNKSFAFVGKYGFAPGQAYYVSGSTTTAELVASVSSGELMAQGAASFGAGVNILRGTDFEKMEEWEIKAGSIEKSSLDGANCITGIYDDNPDHSYMELLRQILIKTGSNGYTRLSPATWYTLSFWAKATPQTFDIDQTSSAYGFATKVVCLTAGNTVRLRVQGSVSTEAANAGKRLVVYIYKPDWSKSKNISISSTSMTYSDWVEFTPDSTGEYKITSYLYDNTSSVGTVTVMKYELDRGGLLDTYVFPSIGDSSQDMIKDGSAVSTYSDCRATWQLTSAWVRHSVTFKTASLINTSQNAHTLWRLFPNSNATQICMPKLERGTVATDWCLAESDRIGKDGKPGASPALAYRGEYSDISTYYGNNSRVDAVKYNGVYYVARIDAGEIRGIVPSDTSKWNPFGAQFESVATQLFLAEFAYIENLGVRDLLTNQEGKRVHISSDDNSMSLYDGNGDTCIKIEGETYTDDQIFGGAELDLPDTNTENVFNTGGALHSYALYKSGRLQLKGFTYGKAGAISGDIDVGIVAIGSYKKQSSQPGVPQPAQRYLTILVRAYLDSKCIATHYSRSEESQTGGADVGVRIQENLHHFFSDSITAGEHKLWYEIEIQNPYYSSADYSVTVYVRSLAVKVKSNVRMSRYFANGMAVGCSSDQYVETLMNDNTVLHRVVSGGAGIQVNKDVLAFRFGDEWLQVKQGTDGNLKWAVLPKGKAGSSDDKVMLNMD